jgi:hypothetical protein
VLNYDINLSFYSTSKYSIYSIQRSQYSPPLLSNHYPTFITTLSTAAAVGNNGATAWTFNDGTATSAGSMGSAGLITITTFDNAGTIATVEDTQGTALTTQALNTTPQLDIGLAPADNVVSFP